MSNAIKEISDANIAYAATFDDDKKNLGLPAVRRFAILTCMDARLDPAKFAGLSEGDAHIIRNAGGRASDDAIRSLIISYKLFGTKELFVIHHTHCGMELFTDNIMGDLLESSLESVIMTDEGFKEVGTSAGSPEGKYIKWLTIDNQVNSLIEDVHRIRTHPLVPASIAIYGYIYDVKSGKLIEVPEATSLANAES
ncbi:Beta-carbonic anhydrase 1 [Photorhabdus australis subsp. thailandensis]|uniref:Beta-carbonic anhydrase 1 n=1 Tax=Photorhabdus australis subsp. thailandensis TaxID=2805096 RepID=A0A1C0U730_9GAMM|nr:carbonic anhydrase [Photorhabdus australis]OCQ53724.1 Beta-carbonic anhydrase 1 [Photorhabdus australis subsp. thailandensis]